MRTESTSRARRALIVGGAGLAWLAAVAAGCPGTLDDKQRFLTGSGGGGGTATCLDVPSTILGPRCGTSGCHGPSNPSVELDLKSPNVAERVVGRPALQCSGILADPQDPDDSVLYTKLLDAPPCGAQMPFGQDPLSAAEIECVKAWIAEQPLPEPPTDGGGTDGAGGGGGAGGNGAAG